MAAVPAHAVQVDGLFMVRIDLERERAAYLERERKRWEKRKASRSEPLLRTRKWGVEARARQAWGSARQHGFRGSVDEYISRQRDIFARIDAGETAAAVARDYGLSPGTVRALVVRRRRQWQDSEFVSALRRLGKEP